MSDLISREAAIEALKRAEALAWEFGYHNVIGTIRDLPAIDQVKHGRWIDRRSIAAPNRYECSVCKRMTIVDECMGEPIYCYCPWCGAKTKGAE